MGFLGAALLLCVARGPREKRWVGWGGGWQIRKDGDVAKKGDEEKASGAGGEEDSADNSQGVDEKHGRDETAVAVADLTKIDETRDAGTGSR